MKRSKSYERLSAHTITEEEAEKREA